MGTPFSSRGGGENTATINIPTIVPANNHKSDIIILIRVYCKMGDTGMTGMTGDIGVTGMTGMTGDVGVTGPTYIMTLDQLVMFHNTIVQYENSDRAALNFIISPSSSEIQQNLVEWASVGLCPNYRVLSLNLSCPSPCSDSKVRDIYSYISYLTGSDIATLVTTFQSNFLGIAFSYTITGNIINLHASKA